MRIHSKHASLGAGLACLPLIASCGSTASAMEEQRLASAPGEGTERESASPEGAIEAIRAGDLERGRDLLDELLVARYLDTARQQLAANRPEDGLVTIDRALSVAPRDDEVRLAKARGSLLLAEKKIADGGAGSLIEGALADAKQYYLASASGPESLLGASRAAMLAGDVEDALTYARRADAALEGQPEPRGLSFVPERVLSEAAFRSYTNARAAEDAEAASLCLESEEALERLLGRSADDPWAWGTLADLYEWEERLDDSQAILLRGLSRLPGDPDLFDRLARVARKSGGAEAVIATFGDYAAQHPDVALARYYAARARFDQSTDQLVAGFATDQPKLPDAGVLDAFQAAEAGFEACRETDPAFEGDCRGYEVMCRDAEGWFHYQRDELEQATAAFLSMNDVVERGMEWSIEGRLLSGVQGLHLVGTRYNDLEDWEAAAKVYAELAAYQPEETVWANNTGFFYREAAMEHERRGKLLCRAAEGEQTPAEALSRVLEAAAVEASAGPQALAAAANRELERACGLISQSVDAYLEAARLAPDDVRVLNDTALVLVYYQHSDLDLAERLLRRCVELGDEQLEDESLADDARWELKNAWGDAHQNLGVLFAIHRDDPEEAQKWLEKAVEIGPEPRPLISNFWLPLLRGEIPASDAGELYALQAWGRPCVIDGR